MGTSSVVSAATTGGTPLLIFSLAVAGIVIVLLLALVVWFAKSRIKARQQYEATLEKRLSSGASTMQTMKLSIEQLQTKFVESMHKLLDRNDFKDYVRDHSDDHDKLDDKLADTRERYMELKQSIAEMDAKMEARLAFMTDLLSKLVKLGHQEDE